MERSSYLSVKATIKPEEDAAGGGIVYIGPPDESVKRKRRTVGVCSIFKFRPSGLIFFIGLIKFQGIFRSLFICCAIYFYGL